MTKFTTTAAVIIGTTKACVETVAGVEGYATPLTWGLSETQGADIASVAGVTDIGAATGPYVHITGTNTITGLGTCTAGQRRTVKFTGALTLTHNGTSLILPGAANITTAANDTAEFCSLGSGNWICLWYKLASGLVLPAALATSAEARAATSTTKALSPANLAARSAFHANKNSSAQSDFTDNTYVQVTFGTETYDRAGDYASNLWTPPAGAVRIRASLTVTSTNLTDGDTITFRIMKNGSGGTILRQKGFPFNAGNLNNELSACDLANGTDTYGIWANFNSTGGGAGSMSGSTFDTWFAGEQL